MRVANWPSILAAKIEEWRHRPFQYGSADCWQFAGDVILAITGVDYRDRFPKYESCRAALRILAERGGMLGLAESTFGQPKHVAFANEGDVVIGDFGNGLTAGICLGVNSCATGDKGLIFIPTSKVVAAWSI